MDVVIRPATPHEEKDYSLKQMEGVPGTVFGVGSPLIDDGAYLVAEAVGRGGWSQRKTLFGSNQVPDKDGTLLNPVRDAARIRVFFVHPAWARQGIGSKILQACEAAAEAQGFPKVEIGRDLIGRTPVPRSRLPPYRTFRSVAAQRRVSPADP